MRMRGCEGMMLTLGNFENLRLRDSALAACCFFTVIVAMTTMRAPQTAELQTRNDISTHCARQTQQYAMCVSRPNSLSLPIAPACTHRACAHMPFDQQHERQFNMTSAAHAQTLAAKMLTKILNTKKYTKHTQNISQLPAPQTRT